MSEATARHDGRRRGLMAIAGVLILAIVYLTSDVWLGSLGRFGKDAGDASGDDHDHSSADADILTLSPQAQQTAGIRTGPLTRLDYERTLRIPAQVVAVPGVSEHEITSKCSGEITKIYVLAGQEVLPGEPLFDIRLTHEEAIQTQIELIDALAELEVANAEIARLETLERSSPGAVPRTRLLKQQYDRRHAQHKLDARRQMLLLLGLDQNSLDRLIEKHRLVHHSRHEPTDGKGTLSLLDTVTVFAPKVDNRSSTGAVEIDQPVFVMETLQVRIGEHVDVGNNLCRLGDYRRLQIVGNAFQRDLPLLRKAVENDWTVTAVLEERGLENREYPGLRILYVDPQIDTETRSANFYVELPNTHSAREMPSGRRYVDWQFRPGQRVELRVPVERFEQKLVLPATAVVREGLENYVFQVSGKKFVRRKVGVLFQDDRSAVLADDDSIFEGVKVANTGAYQLNLALRNRSTESAGHGHGHAHPH